MIHQSHERGDGLRSRTSLAVVCFLLLVAPWKSVAHDPGLSTGQLRLGPDRIEAELTLAQADLESLLLLDANADGRISLVEAANGKPALTSLAHDAFALRLDDAPLVVEGSDFRLDATNNLHLAAAFTLRPGDVLTIRSALIDRLPRGHRQFLTVLDSNGVILNEALLSSGQEFITVNLASSASETASSGQQTFFGFLTLGIEHILGGYDHLLFLFALLIVVPNFRSAALIITCFTLAHSITLSVATLDLVNLDSRYVEPLIAATIVYVGVENLVRRKGPRGRCLLTFGFGLIHGFGFASVLRELGVSAGTGGIAMPLCSFNLGVELGQIAITSVVLPILLVLRTQPVYVRRLVPAWSVMVVNAGAWWLLQRTIL